MPARLLQDEANHLHPLFLAGPTAVGKSAVAMELASRLSGEIISVDSMQVYKGLDIGTAKPAAEERKSIPHHLIDVVNLDESFNAGQFVQLAKAACNEIKARGKLPIFCGGTGLYFQGYLEGVGEAPPSDEQLRAELEKTPLPELLVELEKKDPVAYGAIDKNNPRRVVRALEVIRLTGSPYSQQRSSWKRKEASPTALIFGLERDLDDLRQRIDQRVDIMFKEGLISEVQTLLQDGLEQNRTAMQAIGYRQVVEYLRGERSLDETVALVKQRTRQFAKRQMTWFRHQAPVQWFTLAPLETPAETAEKLLSFYSKPPVNV